VCVCVCVCAAPDSCLHIRILCVQQCEQ